MVRNLEGEKLEGAEACRAPVMRRFATRVRKDLSAVMAGLTERWSRMFAA
jgi:hypothetical protein